MIQGWYCKEKLDASHSEGLKQTIKKQKQKQEKVGGVQNRGEETTIMSEIGGKVISLGLFTWGKD